MDKHPPRNAGTVESLTSVVEQLEEDVVFGRLRPRERLIEEDLVERFNVKRHIIRQALIELERMGIVVRQRGKGARVCEFSPERGRQPVSLRGLLEEKAARLVPLPADKDLIKELTAIHRGPFQSGQNPEIFGKFSAPISDSIRCCSKPAAIPILPRRSTSMPRNPTSSGLCGTRSAHVRGVARPACRDDRGLKTGIARVGGLVPRAFETVPESLHRGLSGVIRGDLTKGFYGGARFRPGVASRRIWPFYRRRGTSALQGPMPS